VVQVNHPFNPYGYFASLKAGVAPGGFNPGFDLMEINSMVPNDDPKVLAKLWEFWNAGQRYYLAAGSDTHDVWNDQSGRVRTFAHLEGQVSAQAFAQALKAGHAYVSYGPLIFPSVMFGSEMKVRGGERFTLAFELASVAGVSKAALIRDGNLEVSHAGWYALEVEDRRGRKAYTDPVWITIAPPQS